MLVKLKFISSYSVCGLLFFATISHALMNGIPTLQKPDLVRLVFQDGSMCTGNFIDPYTVLTAAHCLSPVPGETFHRLDKILSENDEALTVQQLGNVIHPGYRHQFWPSRDLGLIKTTYYSQWKQRLELAQRAPASAKAKLYGCGVVNFDPKLRARSEGENWYLRIASVLLFVGKSHSDPAHPGEQASIAPNDSGAPITLVESSKIIAVATQTTVGSETALYIPVISLATSTTDEENAKFISAHLGLP